MNSKISEFINVAARQFEQEAGSDTMRIYYDRAMEIFAELIIKECLNIIDDVCDSWNNPEWRILEHFGIDHDWRNIDKNILQLDITLTQDQMYNIVKTKLEKSLELNNERQDFTIFWWVEEDGVISYRCRGTGPTYQNFYNKWIPKSSYRCIGEDFPWDFFVFDDEKDHERLLNDFSEYISEDI